jgi:hypothetical protein
MAEPEQRNAPRTPAGEIFPLLAKLRSAAAALNDAAGELNVLHAKARVSGADPATVAGAAADISATLDDLADHVQWVRDGIKGIDPKL